MKIRWTNNSVRFRITPGELESLQKHQPISEKIGCGNGYWEANISIGDITSFSFEKTTLQITLSPSEVKQLADPEKEGVYFSTKADKANEGIRYFIEKDFPCAHPRASEAEETPTETFEPPPNFEDRKNK